MDTDRAATLNAQQPASDRSIRSPGCVFSLPIVPTSQSHGTPIRNNSGQSTWFPTPRNLMQHFMGTDPIANRAQARHNHRLPRFLHNILDFQCRERPADKPRRAQIGRLQHRLPSSDWTEPLNTRTLDRQPAFRLLKRTPESPDLGGKTKVEFDEEEQKEPRRFYCKACTQWVAFVSDTLQVGDIPTLTLQINPHGFVHEVITVKYVVHCLIAGDPVPADSWFPGYNWRFLLCQQCQSHLGWSYHRPREMEMAFAGLRKACVVED